MQIMSPLQVTCAHRDRLLSWLTRDVFPLWGTTGTDEIAGGFFEKIAADGMPSADPRRARVVGRQIYSFANAARLGWEGPAEELTRHGLDFLDRYFQDDGRLVSVIASDGTIARDTFDLYDYAFVLFGLAAATEAYPWAASCGDKAAALRDFLFRWKHKRAGFEEALPRTLPLKANPHMHMLEASLAWVALRPEDAQWGKLANEIAELAIERFVNHSTGALFEFYDGDWWPLKDADSRLVEPGHQCEWGWLLARWGRLRGRDDAIVAGRLLVSTAERHGVDARRGIMFNELHDDFSARDRGARLWPQTERIKGWLALYQHGKTEAEQEQALERVSAAIDGLLRFKRSDPAGAYYDRMEDDGSFREEAAPASSLYHIVCAARELQLVLPA